MSQDRDSTPDSVMMLSGDLLFCSRVKAAATAAGLQFRMGGQLPTEDTDNIAYVVLDLSTRSGLTSSIVGLCHEKCPNAKLIAYGPHVDVNKLHAARTAGIETVLSNGQFSSQMQSIFDS
ncbi:MAG: histidine kinase [Rubripirellula sp.]